MQGLQMDMIAGGSAVDTRTSPTIFDGMAILNIQITNASLLDIEGGIGTGVDNGAWISTSYLIGEIVVIPLTDYLSRVFSFRRYMAAWADPARKLDSCVARTTTEISDDQTVPDISRSVECIRCGTPLKHGLVARHALSIDVGPMLDKQFGLRHAYSPLGGYRTRLTAQATTEDLTSAILAFIFRGCILDEFTDAQNQ